MKRASITLAAAVLLAGVSAASAATMQSPSSNATMSRQPSDTLNLTIKQRNVAWNDLHGQTEQKAPLSFHATTGATVPSSIKLQPVPSKLASAVSSLKPYDFAMIRGKLVIVNPSDKKVAAAMSEAIGS
jgi:Protein of unknown function (DUF1236)